MSISLRALYHAIERTQPHKVIAACLGLAADKLSRIWSGEKSHGWHRYDELPVDTRKEFIRLLARAEGMDIREPSKRAEALADVLMATAMALRDSDFTERLPARADAMATATLDQPAAPPTRKERRRA